jgi:hypothetical protein
MGPKAVQENKPNSSKKAVRAKKEQKIGDLTFGLKNKGKSAKVKLLIDRAEKCVKHSFGDTDVAAAKAAKKDAKLAKMLQEEELRILFNEGIAGQAGKKKSQNKLDAEKLGLLDQNKDVAHLLDGMSSDSDDDDDDDYRRHDEETTRRGYDDQVNVEVFREKTIEDLIDDQRAKLAAEGKVGTPVTADSFAKWTIMKIARRQAEAEARVKAEAAKKKGGKGLSILSGRELFNYNASLFIDDEGAIDASEENALAMQTQIDRKAEEDQEKRDAEMAQAEQLRLQEAHRLEEEARLRREEERRVVAREARDTFLLGNIVINQIVFDVEEREDLVPFDEEWEERNAAAIAFAKKMKEVEDEVG